MVKTHSEPCGSGYHSGVPLSVIEVNHPILKAKLTLLRSVETPRSEFRKLVADITSILILEASKDANLTSVQIQTPLENTSGSNLADVTIGVPVLRAGLAMVSAFLDAFPEAEIGFVGLERDEQTSEAQVYFEKLPATLDGHSVYLLDPMLATGGSIITALRGLVSRGAKSVSCLVLLAAPEGIEAVRKYVDEEQPSIEVQIVLSSLEDSLDPNKYIRPGLGDAGDRIFGSTGN